MKDMPALLILLGANLVMLAHIVQDKKILCSPALASPGSAKFGWVELQIDMAQVSIILINCSCRSESTWDFTGEI